MGVCEQLNYTGSWVDNPHMYDLYTTKKSCEELLAWRYGRLFIDIMVVLEDYSASSKHLE